MNDLNTKESLQSHFALQVALQTMKERCKNLQLRLQTYEDENVQNLKCEQNFFGHQNEVELLRDKVGELTRQKIQLTEHIAMVATENRQLWTRLSKLTKDKSSPIKMEETTDLNNSNCLIRSKTFTQSPNPVLRRHKISSSDNDYENDDIERDDEYLFDNEKSLEIDSKTKRNSIGFGYYQDETINNNTTEDIKKVFDHLHDFKAEILKQQSNLNNTLQHLRTSNKTLEVCKSCVNKDNSISINLNDEYKPKTADKCLETDPSLLPIYNTSKEIYLESPKIISAQIIDDDPKITTTNENKNLDSNILQQKQKAEKIEKMCPMCGKIYSTKITFDEFQEHVESHFIDDSIDYHNIEQNFEMVSRNILDF